MYERLSNFNFHNTGTLTEDTECKSRIWRYFASHV